MSVPKWVSDGIAEMRAERMPLAARLDALDLAIDNLSRAYGLRGMPQPQPTRNGKPRQQREASVDTKAGERRSLLLSLIGKAQAGVTMADLRKATPKMDGKDRSNALQGLKALGHIARRGNAWVKNGASS